MNKVRRAIGSSVTLTLAIVLLAVSAVTGNVFQGAGRADLKAQLGNANMRIRSLETQIADLGGESECRSRIASASELQSGRILVAIADLVIAARDRDDDLGDLAIIAIASARELLGPALDARQEAVDLCKGDPDYRVPDNQPDGIEPDEPTSTTTTTVRRAVTGRSTTTTAATTTTTTYRSAPAPQDPCVGLFPIIPVLPEVPCL